MNNAIRVLLDPLTRVVGREGMKVTKCILAMTLASAGSIVAAEGAEMSLLPNGTVTDSLPSQGSRADIDYSNAKAMPLPSANILPPPQGEAILNGQDPRVLFGNSGHSKSDAGSGAQTPTVVHPPRQ
jgi:hypothetical protein